VLAIIGPVFTKTAIPAAIAADDLNTPIVSPTATDERISDLGEYVFQLDSGLQTQADLLARHSMRRMGLSRFAVIHPEDGYGRSLSARFSSEVLNLGGEISAVVGYERGKTDFKDEIEILKEDTVDAIFIPAYSDDVIMIATQLRYYEVETPLLGANGWKSSTLLGLAREYIEGSVFTAFELDADSAEADRAFSLRYRERYGGDPLRQSAQGFDAGRLIAEAVSTGVDTPGRLRDYLNSRPPSVGASGLVYTARNPSTGVVGLYTIRKGRIERVE
jgi:branched-chain amino acid transport system substrate-binding protein